MSSAEAEDPNRTNPKPRIGPRTTTGPRAPKSDRAGHKPTSGPTALIVPRGPDAPVLWLCLVTRALLQAVPAIVLRIAENPEIDVLPAEDSVRRVCPLVPSSADPAHLGPQLDVFVRAIVKIGVGVGLLMVSPDLLLVILGWGINQLVPPTTRPHGKDADERIVEPVEPNLKGRSVSNPA